MRPCENYFQSTNQSTKSKTGRSRIGAMFADIRQLAELKVVVSMCLRVRVRVRVRVRERVGM